MKEYKKIMFNKRNILNIKKKVNKNQNYEEFWNYHSYMIMMKAF